MICPKFYTDNHKHPPPLDIARVTSSTLPKFEKHPYSWTFTSTPPPLGHCLCDVIIHIPKGLICSFLWPIFSSCFARISPTVCPNLGGGSCPPCPPASYAYGSLISKYKSTKFMHYHTYTKLFNSLVCPITEYGAGIWGLGEFENIILLTACRTYLGAHRHVAKTCLVADMG